MRLAIVHQRVDAGAAPDDRDVLVQATRVEEALDRLGHEPVRLQADLDLGDLAARLRDCRPAAVFNLVESLGGHESLIHVVPSLLDALGLPYTGSPAAAIFATTDKLAAKARLAAADLPVPPTAAAWPPRSDALPSPATGRLIVKSVWDHGSVGIDDAAVMVAASAEALERRLRAAAPRLGGACFAEPYVEGREFNLTLLAAARGRPTDDPEVLAPAEIEFVDYPAGKPRIVGYEAKWQPDSFEYSHTPRTFCFTERDRPLLRRLEELAVAAWRLFGLRGYARVDFRVDTANRAAAGRPFILEVNVNPCLAPDAGMAAALEESGIPYDDAVRRILDEALAAPHAATVRRGDACVARATEGSAPARGMVEPAGR